MLKPHFLMVRLKGNIVFFETFKANQLIRQCARFTHTVRGYATIIYFPQKTCILEVKPLRSIAIVSDSLELITFNETEREEKNLFIDHEISFQHLGADMQFPCVQHCESSCMQKTKTAKEEKASS